MKETYTITGWQAWLIFLLLGVGFFTVMYLCSNIVLASVMAEQRAIEACAKIGGCI